MRSPGVTATGYYCRKEEISSWQSLRGNFGERSLVVLLRISSASNQRGNLPNCVSLPAASLPGICANGIWISGGGPLLVRLFPLLLQLCRPCKARDIVSGAADGFFCPDKGMLRRCRSGGIRTIVIAVVQCRDLEFAGAGRYFHRRLY